MNKNTAIQFKKEILKALQQARLYTLSVTIKERSGEKHQRIYVCDPAKSINTKFVKEQLKFWGCGYALPFLQFTQVTNDKTKIMEVLIDIE